MKSEFIIQRQGKDFVLYSGLLDEAHERYQKFDIQTKLIKTEPIAIVTARFEGETKDGRVVKTSGIGDAGGPDDKSGPAKNTPIRMAETRAKARALRDAVNVGATSLEELGGEEDAAQGGSRQQTASTSGGQRQGARDRQNASGQGQSQGQSDGNVSELRGAAPREAGKLTAKTRQDLIAAATTLYGDGVGPEEAILTKLEEATGKRLSSINKLTEPVAKKILNSLTRALQETDPDPEPDPPGDGTTLEEDDLEEIEELVG